MQKDVRMETNRIFRRGTTALAVFARNGHALFHDGLGGAEGHTVWPNRRLWTAGWDVGGKIGQAYNVRPGRWGGAVGRNPVCIILPCHRVVGANGNLTVSETGWKTRPGY